MHALGYHQKQRPNVNSEIVSRPGVEVNNILAWGKAEIKIHGEP